MAEFHCQDDPATKRCIVSGALTVHTLMRATAQLHPEQTPRKNWQAIDISGLQSLDTAGALMLSEIGRTLAIAGANAQQRALLELVSSLQVPPTQKSIPRRWQDTITQLGKRGVALAEESKRVVTFMGKSAVALARAARHPHRVRFGAVSHHIADIGVNAMPIIGLIAFLISVVLAYQGVAQLRPYGGEQFTVDLVAISILREMGVLLTAIMVAGRSGSAFTAEIGVMKAREEVDALEVMGIAPFDMLVVPRLIAVIIALPLLTFFANMLGLIGGYFITNSLIDIQLMEYLQRVHRAAQGADFLVGLVKAPVFAFVIGVVGCMHGLRVSGSAESIGRETTASVVKSIFLVLVLDAFFSILFEQVGL